MLDIHLRYTFDIPKYSGYIPCILPIYAYDLLKIHPKYTGDKPVMYLRNTRDKPEI